MSPFYALHGYDPRWTTELDIRQDNPEEQQAQQVAERLDEIHAVVKAEMAYAQARQQESADRRRIPAPVFHIGDKVWLNAKNLRTRRPSRKLDNKRFGPFRVTRPIGDLVQLFCDLLRLLFFRVVLSDVQLCCPSGVVTVQSVERGHPRGLGYLVICGELRQRQIANPVVLEVVDIGP